MVTSTAASETARAGAGSRLRLGTAPDSWGVWFADDPRQLPWAQFLDEAARSDYEWIELGPYGYLPTAPGQLRDELGRRGLRLSGGAVQAGLHRGPDALAAAIAECRREAELLTALGASYLVLLPEQYTDLAGNLTQPAEPGRQPVAAADRRRNRAGPDHRRGVRRPAGLPPAR